ncbi:MAG: 16S rRNA (guanine(527)-N(7))-methyltransferase RsmG [Candidimonas sp.]|nr:MAG: 16S rRNA (guanine(527)-N(7))-methyltransferase RsmG [Candidimonas sp.]
MTRRQDAPSRTPEGREGDAETIIAAALGLGVALTKEQSGGLLTYVAELQKWNCTYNLTALRDHHQILVNHLFDCLSVIAPMRAFLATPAHAAPKIVDVGSGAGLPGVVIALANPGWDVYCVDSVEKKTAFVRQIGAVLGLRGLKAIHGRIEALPPFEADLVVSRAFASLPDFAILAGGHVGAGGCLLAMKGKAPEEPLSVPTPAGAWQIDRVQPLTVPGLAAQRCLVWMRHHRGTP